MKNYSAIAVILILCTVSCVNRRYDIQAHAKVKDIEKSIHTQFYAAMQDLNLQNGITIVPQSLNVKFDHTVTTTASAGFTALSIVTANYQYQSIKDNSITDILVPTKISAPSAVNKGRFIAARICPFDPAQTITDPKVLASIATFKDNIEAAAETFADVPNMGLLNDHQVSMDLKFTFSNDGSVAISPLFTYLFLSKLTGKFDKNIASTDDITFTFDVVKNDQNIVSNARYNFLRDSIIKAKGGICGFFPVENFTNEDASKYLLTPPVENQHDFNSCVAYSVGYTALSTILNTNQKKFDETNEYSPDFLFARLTDKKCDGLDLPTVLNEVIKEGDCTIKTLPIVQKLDCSTYNDDAAKARISAAIVPAQGILNKVSNGWVPLDPNNIDQIRLCLDNNEPVIVAFYVSSSFTNMWDYGDPSLPDKNIWRTQVGPYTDAHCVCIIGYDNKTKLFKVQNSWGTTNSAAKTKAEEGGYFWVTYDLVQQGCFNQAYSFIPVSKM